ncbi:hypothetical protein [Apilactobacillus timberlakei]|uniref:Uncharacterized protein n=1 Tax=Apilactobacillus timberlakei TaxID=2008380 RepID=A0ABY2YSN0_9LACO|nr:hypothetical protein [Apilactobacillus timberlakei]TPR12761.1 hypothetical protein DY048_07055 [Apilactobacillus timberlakei]TPR13644.1 hypothetical protein DY052_07925 [Apilactobacillus timberlakei]
MFNFLAMLLGLMIFAALIAAMINQLMLRYFAYKSDYINHYLSIKRKQNMLIILTKEMSKMCTTEEIKEIISSQTGVDLNKSKENK